MFTHHVTQLQVGEIAPLYVQRVAEDGPARWRRIGTIARTQTHLRVVFDACATGMLPVWDACALAPADATGVRVRFGVARGRAGMAIVATGAVPRAAFPAVPRRRRGGLGVGPRGVRGAWPAA